MNNIAGLREFSGAFTMVFMTKLLLNQVLERKKLSKRQFAKKLDIDYASVFRFFRPGYDPKLSTLERWAKILDVRISDLFEESKTKRR